jgi:lysozyme
LVGSFRPNAGAAESHHSASLRELRLQVVTAWLAKVEAKTGKPPMVYTSKAFWKDRGIPETMIEKISLHYRVWIANYSRSARAVQTPDTIDGAKETLWQFSESALVPKELKTQKVDANIFKGTEEEFLSNLGLRVRKARHQGSSLVTCREAQT